VGEVGNLAGGGNTRDYLVRWSIRSSLSDEELGIFFAGAPNKPSVYLGDRVNGKVSVILEIREASDAGLDFRCW